MRKDLKTRLPKAGAMLVVNAERRRSMRPHQVAWQLMALLGAAVLAGGLATFAAVVLKVETVSFGTLALPVLDDFGWIAIGLGLVSASIVSLDHPRVARAAAVVIALTGAVVMAIATVVVATEILGDGMDGSGRNVANLGVAAKAGALALFLVVAAIIAWRYAGEEGDMAI